MKTIHSVALAAAFPLLLSAGEPPAVTTPLETDGGLDFMSALNAAEFEIVGSFGMDFDNSTGGIDNTSVEAGAFLTRPIDLFAGYKFIPYLELDADFLRPDDIVPAIPLGDEDLYEIDLSLVFYKMDSVSPWISGVWINPSLSSDFDSISGDDFFLDVAAFGGYKMSDTFILGVGAGALNVTGDMAVYPGIGFSWNPTEDFYAILYGPNFRAAWEISDSWRLGFEVRPNGGIWNIDTVAGSRNLDYSSYRTGLTSSHRLTEKLWLAFGGGVTLGNSFNIQNTDGSDLYKNQLDDLDTGYYGFIALNVKAW